MNIDCVDSHFHVWDLKRFSYSWPTPKEAAIFRNVPLEELQNSMAKSPVRHAVFVQCLNGSPEEAKWVMEQAASYPFIKGVVAGIDLTDQKLCSVLDEMQKYPLFKGIRHILDFEDSKWITQENVHAGLSELEKRGITYDLLIRLKFVVDHIAKPYIKDKKIEGWKEEISEIAKFQNVYCKLSGLVNEADSENWKTEDFQPYVDHVLSCFGVDRCMFGSDWPVCTLSHAEYKDVFDLLCRLLQSLPNDQKVKIFRQNAANFYNLNIS